MTLYDAYSDVSDKFVKLLISREAVQYYISGDKKRLYEDWERNGVKQNATAAYLKRPSFPERRELESFYSQILSGGEAVIVLDDDTRTIDLLLKQAVGVDENDKGVFADNVFKLVSVWTNDQEELIEMRNRIISVTGQEPKEVTTFGKVPESEETEEDLPELVVTGGTKKTKEEKTEEESEEEEVREGPDYVEFYENQKIVAIRMDMIIKATNLNDFNDYDAQQMVDLISPLNIGGKKLNDLKDNEWLLLFKTLVKQILG